MRCAVCKADFQTKTERRSFKPVRKKVDNHYHYGSPFIEYGICDRGHYTKIRQTRVNWNGCRDCKYLNTKNRKREKEIPTFIQEEFDKMGTKIRAEIRDEVRAELELEMKQQVKWQVENTINRILNEKADSSISYQNIYRD